MKPGSCNQGFAHVWKGFSRVANGNDEKGIKIICACRTIPKRDCPLTNSFKDIRERISVEKANKEE